MAAQRRFKDLSRTSMASGMASCFSGRHRCWNISRHACHRWGTAFLREGKECGSDLQKRHLCTSILILVVVHSYHSASVEREWAGWSHYSCTDSGMLSYYTSACLSQMVRGRTCYHSGAHPQISIFLGSFRLFIHLFRLSLIL